MLHLKKFIIAGCVVSCMSLCVSAQDNTTGPSVRWGSELSKAETPSQDAMKKMAVDLNDIKARLLAIEE
jgi:hypothetical protein